MSGCRRLLLAAIAVLTGAGPGVAQDAPAPLPPAGPPALTPAGVQLVVCQAAREQQLVERRWRAYEYRREDVVEKLDGVRITGRSSTDRFIHRTRPDGVAMNETVAKDGRPLPPDEQARQKAKVAARREQLANPVALREAVAEAVKSSAEKGSTMAAMNDAFDLAFLGLDWIDGEPAWAISFTPRSSYRPTTREQAVFQKMQGVAWVRVTRPSFLRIEADFIASASIKFGPFAQITPGSHFLLEQHDVEPGVIMTRSLVLDLRLRLFLIVSRSERRIQIYRDLKRVNPLPRLFIP